MLLSPVFVYCKNNKVAAALKELHDCIEKRTSFEEIKKLRIQNLSVLFYKGNIVDYSLCIVLNES